MGSSSAQLGPGTTFGAYRIVRQIGAGGMGAVFEAVDVALGRRVAIKVIAPALAHDEDFRARFTREARAQASLDSPHVVELFAHGEIDGNLYIAAQLVPDGDLGKWLREHGPLPAERAVDLIGQVAAGLSEAHRIGLVHRDIKPGNVLLRHRGDRIMAYLADFGLAQPLATASPAERDGRKAPAACQPGTPEYQAPEVRAGDPGGVASDVFALGALLAVTLTGRPLGAESSTLSLLRAVPHRDLRQIVTRATAPVAADRYHSVVDLLAALRKVEQRLGRRSVRGRHPAFAVGAVAVATIAVALPRMAANHRGQDESREVEAIAAIASALREGDALDRRTARCVASRLVVNGNVDRLIATGSLADGLFDATFECVFGAARLNSPCDRACRNTWRHRPHGTRSRPSGPQGR